MISRIWHGWTSLDTADAYEGILTNDLLPGLEDHEGYHGAYLLRRVMRERKDEVEFITLTLFESMEAIRAFAADGFRGAVVPDAALAQLSRFDDVSSHYEVLATPERPDQPGGSGC